VPVAELISHGVDFARLSAARPLGRPPDGPLPAPLAGLRRPIVGFFGGMDDYRMDADLMVKIALHIAPRGGSLVLVGPEQMDLSRIKAKPNVRHVGQVAPEALAGLAAYFDVGIIPFLRNEFNRLSNPIKVKEYLALGFPIVVTDLPAYAPYAGLIEATETHEQFLRALDRALSDHDSEASARRRAAVAGDDWNQAAARMADLLGCP
jgi:hypothetical protein